MKHAVRAADARMAAEGFDPCNRGRGDIATDRIIADELECGTCGGSGHELRAYRHGSRYRAIVICRSCKRFEEF